MTTAPTNGRRPVWFEWVKLLLVAGIPAVSAYVGVVSEISELRTELRVMEARQAGRNGIVERDIEDLQERVRQLTQRSER